MRIRWRKFELPSSVQVEKETLTEDYGRFFIEPFERGFGHSIGNALRRVLLSSIEGFAITSVKIDGVLHEFTTVPGFNSLEQVALDPEVVKLPGKLAGRKPSRIVVSLEIIEFFQNDGRNNDVVLLEGFKTVGRI